MASPSAYIGTSGWYYKHWKGPFYPAETEKEDFFDYYVTRFQSVEINNSFYHLPSASAMEGWKAAAPDGFLFSVKASRYITHMKKLKVGAKTVPVLLDRVSIMGPKLGPILFQLPPHWRFNEERFASFLGELPKENRFVFEFRDESWFNDKAYDLMASRNAAFCIYDLAGRQSPREVTADFVYVRLHGPGGPYQGTYDRSTLAGWAETIAEWLRQGRDAFLYFDNDQAGYAARDALLLRGLVEGAGK